MRVRRRDGLSPLGSERAFHRRLQHGGPVLPQLRPHALQCLDSGIEVGEQFVERVNDAPLLGSEERTESQRRAFA